MDEKELMKSMISEMENLNKHLADIEASLKILSSLSGCVASYGNGNNIGMIRICNIE